MNFENLVEPLNMKAPKKSFTPHSYAARLQEMKVNDTFRIDLIREKRKGKSMSDTQNDLNRAASKVGCTLSTKIDVVGKLLVTVTKRLA